MPRIGEHDATLPKLPEVLRAKAFPCLERNATRDYLDLAAHIGIAEAGRALRRMDEFYPQKNGDVWAARAQLVMQLAAPGQLYAASVFRRVIAGARRAE